MAENFKELIEEQKKTTTALENLTNVTGSSTEALSSIETSNLDRNSIISGQREDTRSAEQIEKDRIKMEKVRAARDAKGKSAEEEDKKEEAANSEKSQSILGRIAGGITDLFKFTKEKAKDVVGNKFFKGAAMIALFMLLPKVLNHPIMKKTIKFIEDTVIPNLKKIKDFLLKTFGEDSLLIAGLLGITMILKPGLIVKPLMLAVKGLRLAFMAVKFFINNQLTRGLLNIVKSGKIQKLFMAAIKGLRVAFMAIRTFMMGTLIPAITGTLTAMATAIAPLLIPAALIIAAATVLLGIFKSINDAFNQFNETLSDTGSVGEAIKAAISRFFGALVSFIPGLFLKLIGFVAKMFGFDNFAESLPSMSELSDIMTQGIMDAINFVADIFSKAFDAIKNFGKGILQRLGLMKKEEDMTPEELNEQKTKDLLKEQKDETKRRKRLNAQLGIEQKQLTAERRRAEKLRAEGKMTQEDFEGVVAMEKSGIKALAENRFFLEKSRETEDALRADLKSENFRIARGEGEFGQGDMSGMTKTAALKAQEARIDKINDAMLEKYGYKTNQQGQPVIINNDSSIRSSSSNTQTVNETITPRDGMLVSASADF